MSAAEGSGSIRVRNAWCIFKHASGQRVEALRGVDLEIPGGQFVCLVGRSGHGKSTLLRALAGLNRLTDGEIIVDGRPVYGPSAERGMVFQEDTVFPWMRVQDNVEFGLRSQRRAAAERRARALEWLAAVGLADFVRSWPKELSGGMRKRVAVATVFAGGARYLLMDEPFGALDYVTRLSLHRLLLDLWARTRRTIVFVTHDIEEALILADRILVMKEGRLVEDIAVGLARPRDEEQRASDRAVAITKTIMRHLGLEALQAAAEERRDVG
jgi:NitT/TauT family transport system ATP-binding protein